MIKKLYAFLLGSINFCMIFGLKILLDYYAHICSNNFREMLKHLLYKTVFEVKLSQFLRILFIFEKHNISKKFV